MLGSYQEVKLCQVMPVTIARGYQGKGSATGGKMLWEYSLCLVPQLHASTKEFRVLSCWRV